MTDNIDSIAPKGARRLIVTSKPMPVAILTTALLLIGPLSNRVNGQQVGTAVAIAFTEGPTVDREGNVYFTDLVWQKILKLSPSGVMSKRTRRKAALA